MDKPPRCHNIESAYGEPIDLMGLLPAKGAWMIQQSIVTLFLVAVTVASAPISASAQSAAELFKDADHALGAQLIQQHSCAACHVRKVGGDGSAIYRPAGRINTPGFLRGMVEQCNTELNLALFPDEVSSIAAVLNRNWYKFK
jgi:hypothetical protein